jgi:hypothetical protein
MLTVRPIELREANAFVARHHRHHKPVVNHRFSLACYDDGRVCGVAIVGRPVARAYDKLRVLEVARLCTDGTRNVCSALYSAAARVGREMGYESIQTYTLASEIGASLRASGWTDEGEAGGGPWDHTDEPPLLWGGPNRRTDQPTETKRRWRKVLNKRVAPAGAEVTQ